jgi:NAD(P)-dependent dehydrogenase (short-subunit alcohol dehydrogenase family)
MPHPRSHLAADTQAIGLFGAKSARPALGSINAGTPLTDRLIPGTVVGIDLLLGRLLRRFCFLDLFCETDHETVSQSRRSCRLERDRSSFGWDYCKAANECHFMSNNMRTAIVTGGGSGIGQDVGLALCAARWTVVIAGRKVGTLERTRQLAQGSGLIETHVTDVTDDASVEQLFDAVVERYGHLDLLFNNAGINVPLVALDQLSTTELRSIIATNLLGSFLCARAAFRVMKAQTPQGGRIINNGSVSAYAPRPNSAPYSATKHGITGLTKSLVLDGRAFNIACGQIDIGNATTDMSARMATGAIQANGTTTAEPRIPAQLVAELVVQMAN